MQINLPVCTVADIGMIATLPVVHRKMTRDQPQVPWFHHPLCTVQIQLCKSIPLHVLTEITFCSIIATVWPKNFEGVNTSVLQTIFHRKILFGLAYSHSYELEIVQEKISTSKILSHKILLWYPH